MCPNSGGGGIRVAGLDDGAAGGHQRAREAGTAEGEPAGPSGPSEDEHECRRRIEELCQRSMPLSTAEIDEIVSNAPHRSTLRVRTEGLLTHARTHARPSHR